MDVILINKCDDKDSWYADKIQDTVPLIAPADDYGILTSFDKASGKVSPVKESDCTVINVFDLEEPM